MWGFGEDPTQPAVPLHLSIAVAAVIVTVWLLVAAFAWWVMEADPEPDGEDQRGAGPAVTGGSSVLAALFFGVLALALAVVPFRMVRTVAVGYRVAHPSSRSWGLAISLTMLVGSCFVVGSFACVRAAWGSVRHRPST